MISNATKRSILRWIHLIVSIPILGYIYGPPSEVQQYAFAVRFVFAPIIILAGFWIIRAYSSPSLALRCGSVHIACLDLGRLS
jgi:hypothetical protein